MPLCFLLLVVPPAAARTKHEAFAASSKALTLDPQINWDRAKLIALGVSLETIEAATNESSSDPFLVWREKKAKDDGTLPS